MRKACDTSQVYRMLPQHWPELCLDSVPTYIDTYIPWIHKCVTKTTGCGTSHKYKNKHNFYSVNIVNTYKTLLSIIFTYKTSATEYKESVFKYFLKATLTF